MDTFKERLEYLINQHSDGNVKKFAEKAGFSPSSLYYILNEERNSLSQDILMKISKTYKVSLDWLSLMVDAPIYITDKTKNIDYKDKYYDIMEKYNSLLEKITKTSDNKAGFSV